MEKILLILLLFVLTPSFSQTGKELMEKAKKSKDEHEVVALIQKAASLGNSEAQFYLGEFYERGGVSSINKNINIALTWYNKASNQNWIPATKRIIEIYGKGLGVEKEEERAFKLAKECAEKNHPECIEIMAVFYQRGIIVKKDKNEEFEWIEKMALINPNEYPKFDYKIAGARLSLAYSEGFFNLDSDFIKTYTWFLLYNEIKKSIPPSEQESIIRDIEKIEKKLNDEEIIRCRIEAESILGHKLKNIQNLKVVE